MDIPVRNNVLGVGINTLNLDAATEIVLEAAHQNGFTGYVTVTGVHGVMESQADEKLRHIHNSSFLSTPDGMPMVWLGRWAGFPKMDRVYGPDLMAKVCRDGQQQGMRHYLFGGGDGVAEKLRSVLEKKFSKIQIVGTHTPPFRPLTEDEERALVAELKQLKPHFFWVGLSTPKQERFMHDFLEKYARDLEEIGHGMVFFGVGAAFDFHAGLVSQAPRWIQRSGFEWLYRLCMEPRRLFKRYAINNTAFVKKVLPQMMGIREYPLR